MKRLNILAVALLLLATTASAQTSSEHWTWKEKAVKDKPQRQFTLTFQRRGNKVSGTYSVDQFINGKWQGEDGNQTPFVGTVRNGVINVEFDPFATVPGYQQNVKYTRPRDGRTPTKATIKIERKVLTWTILEGEKIVDMPDKLRLTRSKVHH
jgi:hypothetical protein